MKRFSILAVALVMLAACNNAGKKSEPVVTEQAAVQDTVVYEHEYLVKVGDELLAGDIIGGVGETALCETAQMPHVHFAMSLNDKSVDPHDYMPIL